MIKPLQAAIHARSKASWLLQTGGAAGLLAPSVGIVPRAIHELSIAGLAHPGLVSAVPLGLGIPLGAFYLLKGMEVFAPPKPRGIWFGDAFIAEDGLWTSILITGRPGSGKTSGAIMPPFEQIIELYPGPDYIDGRDEDGRKIKVENPHARIGGTVLEVKGEFYEPVGYQMHLCGRNVYEEFFVIRPDSRIPLAKFQDTETNEIFYLNGLPCSSGSEAGRLLMAAQVEQPEEKRIREDIFAAQDKDFTAALPRLRELEFNVEGKEVMYVGWRDDGRKLVRVSHTPEYNKTEFLHDADKKKITTTKPKRLRFVERVLVSNGLQYNLIDPSVPANEAAEKLTRMATMAGRGEGKGGDNSYWYSNAQKLISSCIALRRAVEPTIDVTCKDVYKLVADNNWLSANLKKLNQRLTALQAELNLEKDTDRQHEIQTRGIEPLSALVTYFTGEWVGLDEKTKGIIKTVVSNTFSSFVLDPALGETFCSKPTFTFANCLQKGHMYCFVPGPQYEALAKVIGTGLKVDFQQICMMRLQRADLNKLRPILHLTDECWNWIISGGSGGGDAKFLSLCRQARIMHLLATQNYDQFVAEIGRDATNNYLGEFGVFVWLQNFNELTNRMAEGLMETVKREKHSAKSGGLDSLIDGKGTAAKMEISWEEKKLYTLQDFVQLGGDEAIVFNGYLTKNMAVKTKLPKSRLTHPDEKPKIARFMREYLRGSIEQALWRAGKHSRLDHRPVAGTGPATTPPAATPATQSSPPVSPQPSQPPSTPAPPKPAAPPAPQSAPPPASPQPPAVKPSPYGKPEAPAMQPATAAAPIPAPSTATPAPGATTPPSAPKQEAAQPSTPRAPSPYARKLHFPHVVSPKSGQSAPDATPPAARPEAPRPPAQAAPPSVNPLPAASSLPSDEPQGVQGGAANFTPADIEKQSDDFKRMWGHLTTVAAELVADDDYQIQKWIRKLVERAQAGQSTAADDLVGPAGISAGSPELRQKAIPITDEPLDNITQRGKVPYDVRRKQANEESFTRKAGPRARRWAG